MTKNIGGMDRALRMLIGIAVLSLYFVLPGEERFYSLIGIVPLATGFLSWCPLYTAFGWRT